MSRSQPKPKIIFKTLEDLIKSSSLSKKNVTLASEDLKSYTLPLRSVTEVSATSIKRSNSRHTIQSKQKLPQNDRKSTSISRQCKEGVSVTCEHLDSQIGKIYDEMQSYLHKSKSRVIEELRVEPSNKKVEAKVRELEKMSDYLRHIIDVFTDESSEILLNQRKVLQDCTNENDNTETLSRNHKKKINARYPHNDLNKKPSVYQKILRRLN